VIAAALFAVSALDPLGEADALLVALALFCLASATQDVAIDAYTIGLVPKESVGPVNGVRVTAYRVAILASGAVLFLPRFVGWDGTHAILGVAALAMAWGTLRVPRVSRGAARPPLREVFVRWLRVPGWVGAALFVLGFRLADMAMAPMLRPLWVDRGIAREMIGVWSTGVGSLATIAGGLAGGLGVARLGIPRALVLVGVLSLASNLAYAAAALPGSTRAALYAASVVESFCGGLAAAGFISFLMALCQKEHAAVQYATLTSLYAASGALAARESGVLVEQLGYAGFFALTAALGLPALALLPSATRWLRRLPPA
jgi:PAT family beta-lactamase induction signal transducer AmpG